MLTGEDDDPRRPRSGWDLGVTLARTLRTHREAMHPKPPADIGKFISTVVEWKGQVGEDGQPTPVGPNTLEDGCLGEVLPSGRAGRGLHDYRRCPRGLRTVETKDIFVTSSRYAAAMFRWTSAGWIGVTPRSSGRWMRSASTRSATIAEAGSTHPTSARPTGACYTCGKVGHKPW